MLVCNSGQLSLVVHNGPVSMVSVNTGVWLRAMETEISATIWPHVACVKAFCQSEKNFGL